MGALAGRSAPKKVAAVPADPPPLAKGEPKAILEHALVATDDAYPFHLEGLVYAIEELAGTDLALDALTAAFEVLAASAKKSPKRHPSDYAQAGAAIAAGFLLRRASAKARDVARPRLAKIAAATSSTPALATLALVLGGRDALAKSDYSWTPPESWMFSDDEAFVRDAIRTAKGEVDFDARAVWLGGAEVLPLYAKHVKKTALARMPLVIESLAMFAAPEVAPLMEILAAKRGGEAARAWLDSKGTAAAPKPSGAKRTAVATKRIAAPPKPGKRPTRGAIEAAFDALVDDLVSAMKTAGGDSRKEADALRSAAARYAEIRGWWDTDTTAYMTHFFCADGVALSKPRATAWERLAPTPSQNKRWLAVLEKEA